MNTELIVTRAGLVLAWARLGGLPEVMGGYQRDCPDDCRPHSSTQVPT
jgi:hypothetical protein